jgi:hypothetical protein
MHRSTRVFLALTLLMLLALPLTPSAALAEGANRAGVIVVFGPDQVVTTCVSFGEPQLLGSELLRRAGLRVVSASTAGVGDSICKINGVGCNFPGEHCFCQCLGSPCLYWNYWYLQNGKWVYSGRGAGNRTVRNGDVDAWVWGDGNTSPPVVDPAALCGLAGAAAPTAMPLSATPTRMPASATPVPAPATPAASATATLAVTSTVTTAASPTMAVASATLPAPTVSATASAAPSATPIPRQAAPSATRTEAPPTTMPSSPTPTAIPPARSATGGYIAFGVAAVGILGAILYTTLRRKSFRA